MKQITLHVPDKKYKFFMELLHSLGFVKKIEIKEELEVEKEKEILKGLKDAAEEVKLIKAGKLKPKTLKEFLDEL